MPRGSVAWTARRCGTGCTLIEDLRWMCAEVVGDGRRQHQPTSKALFIVLRDPPKQSARFCVAQRSTTTTRAEVKGSAPRGFSMPPDVARQVWAASRYLYAQPRFRGE